MPRFYFKLVWLIVKCAYSTVSSVRKATTDVAAFSSMVVVEESSAGLLKLKIPMMSYYAGFVIAKSKTEDDITVWKMHSIWAYLVFYY